MLFGVYLNSHKTFKRLAKSLSRLACAHADLSRLCLVHISHGWKSRNASHKRIYKLLQLINSLDWSVNSIMQNFIGP